ncbi:DNA polymerase III [Exiguobacterium sp. N4-1P]|uniref:3'-5' exonuclease n=1 Tax=unclassified Exiguobacterium TaxID=2644629 RepID=UPI000B58A21C|nr:MULTISPECIES: 3'-5' exonuclease [unclassified Exiguobacterium]ASI36630.1 DNA polymerase III [Exiguobacterium sp. N4-1P]
MVQPYTLAIDFETANRNSRSICAFGWSVLANGQVVTSNQVLINPEEEFDAGNIRVHGIRPSDVWNEPALPEAMEQHGLYDLIAGAELIVAHNAAFDMGALQKAIQKYDLYQIPAFRYGCTVKLSRKLYPWLPNHKLNTMADFLGVSFKHHDAKEDAYICALLLNDMLDRTNLDHPVTLHEFCGVRMGQVAY